MKCLCPIVDLDIYNFAFQPIDSRMYVIIDTASNSGRAIVVDPSVSYDADDLLKQKGITYIDVLLTHEHYDHISGVNYLRERFSCNVITSRRCAERLPEPKKNLSYYFESLFCTHSDETIQQVRALGVKPYSCHADTVFDTQYVLEYGDHTFCLRSTPGHTSGSICILLDNCCLFSGDSLLHTPTVTKLPSGSTRDYQAQTLPYLRELKKKAIIYPGHGNEDSIDSMRLSED